MFFDKYNIPGYVLRQRLNINSAGEPAHPTASRACKSQWSCSDSSTELIVALQSYAMNSEGDNVDHKSRETSDDDDGDEQRLQLPYQ